jgi:hypothetical protein
MEKVLGLERNEELVSDIRPITEIVKSVQRISTMADQSEVLRLRELQSSVDTEIVAPTHNYPAEHHGLYLVKK